MSDGKRARTFGAYYVGDVRNAFSDLRREGNEAQKAGDIHAVYCEGFMAGINAAALKLQDCEVHSVGVRQDSPESEAAD